MNFGEKQKEFSPKHGKDLPVWQSPKYQESKAKAEEIINSGKYGVLPSDFWILMNATKNEKMAYTGLIISHNGCLKINDCLESKFDPACVTVDKDGYKGSLVYSYCNPQQGIYEVGEVSGSNCKNEYPYAMAYKRLFDRVVLKLSKLAYAGIYSDSEADEFTQKLDASEPTEEPKPFKRVDKVPAPSCTCDKCGKMIGGISKNGVVQKTAEEVIKWSHDTFGAFYCWNCAKKIMGNREES